MREGGRRWEEATAEQVGIGSLTAAEQGVLELNKPVAAIGVSASLWAVATPANMHPTRNAPMVARLCHPEAARPEARKSGPLLLGPVMCMTTAQGRPNRGEGSDETMDEG